MLPSLPKFGKAPSTSTSVKHYSTDDEFDHGEDVMVIPSKLDAGPLDLMDPDGARIDLVPYLPDRDSFDFHPLGNLRAGEPPISIFQREYLAVAVSAVLAGVTNIWMLYPVKQLTVQYFYDFHLKQKNSVNLIAPWAGVPSVLIGLLSDAVPIYRYRRKSYVLLGSLVAFFMSIGMVMVYGLMDPKANSTAELYLVFQTGANIGLQIAWVALLAASVEYAQRESLDERGSVQAMLFVLYYGGMSVTQVVIASVLWPQGDGTQYKAAITLGDASLILAVLALVPIPFILYSWDEEHVIERPPHLLADRVRELWRVLSQKAVYKLIIALCLMIVFVSANNSNVNTVARYTSGYTGTDLQWLYLTAYPARLFSAALWYKYMINMNWRLVACGGFTFLCAFKGGATLMLIHNALRGRVLYCVMSWFSQIPQGWIAMFQVIPTTEIVYVGREGALTGLVQTTVALITIGTGALWSWVQKVVNLNVSTAEIQADTSEMRRKATIATLLVFGFNTFCILMIFFLPSQKLDAQQMRAYGGYHSVPRYFLLLAYLALLAADLNNNITKLLEML